MKNKLRSQIKDIFTVILTLTALLLTGCSLDSTPGVGNLQVKLHDAPVSYDEVNIFIERVEVNNTNNEEGWITVSEPNQVYDILELRNGVFEVIADTELEAGTYPQIRLILRADSNSVVIDGEAHSLFVPSGAQTGVKLNVNIEIEEGEQYTLLLDFDAQRSIVKTGQAPFPGYLLKPVIRAANEDETGNIGGIVEPFDARAMVHAIAGEDTLSTTYADENNGEFLLVGLEAGTYDVAFVPTVEGYISTRVEGVEVEVGVTTDLGTIELDSE